MIFGYIEACFFGAICGTRADYFVKPSLKPVPARMLDVTKIHLHATLWETRCRAFMLTPGLRSRPGVWKLGNEHENPTLHRRRARRFCPNGCWMNGTARENR